MRLTLTKPDDWHLHLRDGEQMRAVVGHSAAQFGRAIIMPNLKPPVSTVRRALAYRERIREALGDEPFEPLMTLYLTADTTPEEIEQAAAHPAIVGVKLYPAGATTNSADGIHCLEDHWPVLEAMAKRGLPLLVHGETTDPSVDIFDREARFIEETFAPLVNRLTDLKVVLEHVTTREGVQFIEGARPGVGGTLTAHHLLLHRNALFEGGIRPDLYCLPVLKRQTHQRELVRAATGGNPRFFLGTDSAPHPQSGKRSACGCAGIYTAHAALALYAEVFEAEDALDKLEAFASFHGPDFYGVPRNTEKLALVREPWTVPHSYDFGEERLTPLRAGQTLDWQVAQSPRVRA